MLRKIRTKIITTFLSVIALFLAVVIALFTYIQNATLGATRDLRAAAVEQSKVTSLALEMQYALMPGHDYLLTGDRKYVEVFRDASAAVERSIREVEGIISSREEAVVFGEVKSAWRNIEKLSHEVFAIPEPVGNAAAAALMEEMDYKWAYPGIDRLRAFWEIYASRFKDRAGAVQGVWDVSWLVVVSTAALLAVLSAAFAVFYSRLISRPLQAMCEMAESIALGEFGRKLDIATGDEFQQLSAAMNGMASQLESFTAGLQALVEQRTAALKDSEERFRAIAETASDAIVCIHEPDTVYVWNRRAEELFGYPAAEAVGRGLHELIVPERFQESSEAGLRRFFESGQGPLVSGAVELAARRRDGTELPVELSVSAMNIKGRWHATGILRDMTERKRAERRAENLTRLYATHGNVNETIVRVKGMGALFDAICRVAVDHGKFALACIGLVDQDGVCEPAAVHGAAHPGLPGPAVSLREAPFRDGLMGVAERSGQAAFSGDIQKDPSAAHWREAAAEAGLHSAAAVPLKLNGRVAALLNLYATEADLFSEKEYRDLLVEMGMDISIAMEAQESDLGRKKAEEALSRAKKQWENTFDAIEAPLFIHDEGFRIVKCNRAYADAAGMDFGELIGKPYFEVFPKAEGPMKVCSRALDRREKEDDEVFLPDIDRTFRAVVYPLRDEEGNYEYSIHIMEDITEAKKSEGRVMREMEVSANLLMFSEATARVTDVELLMERITATTAQITGVDACLGFLFDREANGFFPCRAYGLSADQNPMFKGTSLIASLDFLPGTAAEERPAVLGQQGLCALSETFHWIEGPRGAVVIPFAGKHGPLGMLIGVMLREKEAFSERDLRIMGGIAHQASTALDEALHYRQIVDKGMELSRRIEIIRAMHEIDRNILSTLDSREIFMVAARTVSNVMPAAICSVFLADGEKGGFVYAAGYGMKSAAKGGLVPFGDTDATGMIDARMPQYVSDLREAGQLAPFEDALLREGLLSYIRVPVIIRGKVAGFLSAGTKRAAAYSPEDLSTLEKLSAQVAVALENAKLVEDLKELFMSTLKTLSNTIDAKSPWTMGHSARVTRIALQIGQVLGLGKKDLEEIEMAGLLHDIGKLGTYEEILNKPGRLTDEELRQMRLHPQKGADILMPIRQLRDIIPAIKYHHEFFDGSGYPDGVKGEEIPLMARILGVADTVDAMASDRPYRKGRSIEEIVDEVGRCSGKQFDPAVVDAFMKLQGEGRLFAEEAPAGTV